VANEPHLEMIKRCLVFGTRYELTKWYKEHPDESLDLSGADLCGKNLRSMKLSGANLSGAQLIGAILIDTNLNGANLDRADLRGAILTRTQLDGATLRQADLSDARILQVVFDGADIAGVRHNFSPDQWNKIR